MSNTAASGDAMGRVFPTSYASTTEMGWRQPFTAAQWRELEHQALIYKYLMAGVPVPPDLLLPIQRSFEALPSRTYHHCPSLSYFSYYGKKLDPEPGRCRRTDGKKWRCTKDAHPDSKYCERHMHRSRNRSRKHVESKTNLIQQQSQSHLSSSSTTTTHVASGSSGSLQSINPQSAVADASKPQGVCSSTFGSSPLQSKLHPCKGYAKTDVDEHNLFSKYPGGIQDGLRVNSSIDYSWGLMPSQVPSFPTSKAKTGLLYDCFASQLDAMQDITEVTSRSNNHQEHQHSNFRSEFGLTDLGKQDCQGLRPFFNEWPKARESWLEMDNEQSEHNSFSATRLSISIPMASSNLSTTTCCSPDDD